MHGGITTALQASRSSAIFFCTVDQDHRAHDPFAPRSHAYDDELGIT
jgi:hypothetical protein